MGGSVSPAQRFSQLCRRVLKKRKTAVLCSGGIALSLWACGAVETILPDFTEPAPVIEIEERTGDFALIADTQQWPGLEWVMPGGPRERAAVRERLKALGPDFILLAGDAVGAGWVKPFWEEFRREYAGMPLYPAVGNHDVMGPNRRARSLYFQTFPNVRRRLWYEIRWGGVAFLVLDSNRGQMTSDQWTSQIRWLAERLEAAEHDDAVRLVALVAHHPALSAARGGGNTRMKEDAYDLAARYRKFRLYLSGHHHAYQHIEEGPRRAFVSGGGGAPQFFRPSGRLPEGARLVKAIKRHHVLLFRAERNGLAVEMHALGKDGGWTVEDTVGVGFDY